MARHVAGPRVGASRRPSNAVVVWSARRRKGRRRIRALDGSAALTTREDAWHVERDAARVELLAGLVRARVPAHSIACFACSGTVRVDVVGRGWSCGACSEHGTGGAELLAAAVRHEVRLAAASPGSLLRCVTGADLEQLVGGIARTLGMLQEPAQ